MRVGIAGAGAAGLATAWLLDGLHDTLLLEARSDIGGNLRSMHPPGGTGTPHALDLGVQEVPLHLAGRTARLADALGLGDGQWTELPSGHAVVCDGAAAGARHACRTGAEEADAAVGLLSEQAAAWQREAVPWTVPLQDLVEPWDLPRHVKDEAVYARPASVFGCTLREARRLSARSVGAFYADPGKEADARTYRLRGGMQALAWQLARRCRSARLVPEAALRRVRRTGGHLEMVDSRGARHPVDAVVLALPADAARRVLGSTGGTGRIRSLLNTYAYHPLVYGVHDDPCYLPADRGRWAPTTVSVHGPWAESTTWRERPEGDLFVSQLTHRDVRPRSVLATTAFRTLQPTPAMLRAQAELLGAQGRGGLYFAGHLTTRVDDLDSVVASAADVARRLAPESPRLAQLTTTTGKESR
ncbi:FAD-dependent oxidoreductase [Streptomyces rimosus]|uniref:FAD-dependent oxidoreductase n=1 Tax=Streptomyces rimosus TaxID=1927 RepID=UPI0004C632CB|nr:FAD-dependent oxidoreductase [Streptomyces rimosus]